MAICAPRIVGGGASHNLVLRVYAPATALLGQTVARELLQAPSELGDGRIELRDRAPDWDPAGRRSHAELWHGDALVSRLCGIYSTEQIAQFLQTAITRAD